MRTFWIIFWLLVFWPVGLYLAIKPAAPAIAPIPAPPKRKRGLLDVLVILAILVVVAMLMAPK